jgi:hypothetical protein
MSLVSWHFSKTECRSKSGLEADQLSRLHELSPLQGMKRPLRGSHWEKASEFRCPKDARVMIVLTEFVGDNSDTMKKEVPRKGCIIDATNGGEEGFGR